MVLDISYIVKSPVGVTLFERAKQLSLFPTTILIEGEIGSGKEILAETIHNWSPRAKMPFIKINCGSISNQTIDSDWFGAERGSSPTIRRNPGLLETAHQGTLFLDEVGEASPELQVKLLRFLQDRENDRPGGSWTKKLDIRIIASTTTPLIQLVKASKFRSDLYYRLNIAYLAIPPLRDRPEEIVPLVEHYLSYFCKEYRIKRWFKKETMDRLKTYSFPGNIRELRNLVERLCVSTTMECILPDDLPECVQPSHVPLGSLESQVGEFESRLIRRTLEVEGSIRKAAARLQVSHATLLRKMQKWEIEK